MSKYADIIERLEKAEGPDRLIDVLVGYAADYVVEDISLRERMDRHGVEYMLEKVDRGFNSIWPLLPRYTSSIDSAIALVERMLPGWRVENLCEWESETLRNRGAWTCDLRENGHDFFSGGRGKCPHAPTPALALLLALFRALDAQETSE